MKTVKLSTREIVLFAILLLLLVALVYYLAFYTPMQNDMAAIEQQIEEVDSSIAISSAKIQSMDAMRAELDEILSRPQDQITEIAPYDNAKVLMNQLNGILASSEEYDISFTDPVIDEDSGFVRRNVSLSFTCESYASAKAIVKNLCSSHWRCLITSLDMAGTENMLEDEEITVKAMITFFESTALH